MLSVCKDEIRLQSLKAALLEILDRAMVADGAAFGNLQVLNKSSDCLEIQAQRGFSQEFLALFQMVRSDDPCVCGRAFRYAEPVFVRDVTADPLFAPFLSISQAVGFRAVQSTPIIDRDKNVIGVLST